MISPADFLNILEDKKLTLATAESITAGLIASAIAGVPGASAVLKGGVVTYDSKVKVNLLGVSEGLINQFSAESQQVTSAMAQGLSKIISADIHLAITGVASKPVNDYKIDKPIGQIYLVILYHGKEFLYEQVLLPDRDQDTRNQIREKAVAFAFEKVTEIINQ